MPTKARVNNNVTPKPKDITVIGVILFVWVIFLIETFNETTELDLNFFRKKIINFESRKTTIKHTKKAAKYPKIKYDCSDTIINNKTGILVPSKNYKALADAINKLSQDKQKLEKFTFETRKFAVANFDIKDVISKHYSIYKKIENIK